MRFTTVNFAAAVCFTVLPVLSVTVLSDTLAKVEALLNHIEGTVQGTVDLSLVNKTLEDINNLTDPLINNLGSGVDELLTKLLG